MLGNLSTNQFSELVVHKPGFRLFPKFHGTTLSGKERNPGEDELLEILAAENDRRLPKKP